MSGQRSRALGSRPRSNTARSQRGISASLAVMRRAMMASAISAGVAPVNGRVPLTAS